MSTDWDINGKTVLVTGGTSGIGFEVARELVGRGAKVIVVGRDAGRGNDALNRVEQQKGKGTIIFVQADLSRLVEVRHLAEQINTLYPELQVLINNAAAQFVRRELTTEGFEKTFATDFLSPFLLTNLLLERLKANAPARIINVNSFLHRRASLNFDDLQTEKDYTGPVAYGRAKLAGVLTTYELARRLEGSNIQANLADPLGAPSTGLVRNSNISQKFFGRFAMAVLSHIFTTKRAAQSTLYLATAPEAARLNGKYLNFRRKVVVSSPSSYDEELAQKVWKVGEELTGVSMGGQKNG